MRFAPALVWIATIAGSGVAMAEEAALSREAFAARAVENGPFAAALAARLAAARAEREAAGLPPNPAFTWDRAAAVSGGRDGEAEDDLALHLPLVLSGRLGLERAAASADLEAFEARARGQRAELRREARDAFDEVLAARGRLAVLTEAEAAATALTRVLAAREKAGESAGYDRERMELEAALVADQRVAAEAERVRVEVAAAGLLGLPGTSLPPLEGDLGFESASAVPAPQDPPERPWLQALAHEAAAARAAALAAERRAVPDPALTAGARLLDLGRSGSGLGYVVGLEIPLPVLDSGAREADRARARALAVEAECEAGLQRVRRELAAARANAEARRTRLAAHRRDVLERAERLRDLAAKAWSAGGAELLTLLDTQHAAREARLTALDLALEARRAETELLFLTGDER